MLEVPIPSKSIFLDEELEEEELTEARIFTSPASDVRLIFLVTPTPAPEPPKAAESMVCRLLAMMLLSEVEVRLMSPSTAMMLDAFCFEVAVEFEATFISVEALATGLTSDW